MCVLFSSFVRLKHSIQFDQVMDRAAITRHLLSDAQDPYNRKPLTVEMLEPNDELRAEIEEWIRYRAHAMYNLPLEFYVMQYLLL